MPLKDKKRNVIVALLMLNLHTYISTLPKA